MNARTLCLAALAVLGTAAGAQAAGFALKEQSAAALGNAFAGTTAGADDPSYLFFNPAAAGWLDGVQASVGASLAMPRARLQRSRGVTAAGTPVGGSTQDGDVTDDELIPAAYLTAAAGDLHLSLAVTAPFGLETSYSQGWVGRYQAVDTELRSLNITPSLAWRAADWLALGVGVQAQRVSGKLTNALDFGTIGAAAGLPGAVPGGADGFARLRGQDWGWGWQAGAIVEPLRGTRLGVAYRSQIEHELAGHTDFTDDRAGIAATLRSATGAFADTDGQLRLKTPASFALGVQQALTSRLTLSADATWTDWSSFDEYRVRFDNAAQPDSVTEQNWRDTWSFALGATWRASDSLTLRTGVAYDPTPVRGSRRSPRIPDADRTWLSFGLGWQPRPWLGLDAAYAHIWVADATVDLSAADAGNGAQGAFSARFDNAIDLLALNARLAF